MGLKFDNLSYHCYSSVQYFNETQLNLYDSYAQFLMSFLVGQCGGFVSSAWNAAECVFQDSLVG